MIEEEERAREGQGERKNERTGNIKALLCHKLQKPECH